MNPTPSSTGRGSSAPGGTRVVWIHVSFSGQYRGAREAVDERLSARLHNTGMSCWVTPQSVALFGHVGPIDPADWSAVIGWLLCQPEVVFVARKFPVTRSSHE